jgi:hypothetical protein
MTVVLPGGFFCFRLHDEKLDALHGLGADRFRQVSHCAGVVALEGLGEFDDVDE